MVALQLLPISDKSHDATLPYSLVPSSSESSTRLGFFFLLSIPPYVAWLEFGRNDADEALEGVGETEKRVSKCSRVASFIKTSDRDGLLLLSAHLHS